MKITLENLNRKESMCLYNLFRRSNPITVQLPFPPSIYRLPSQNDMPQQNKFPASPNLSALGFPTDKPYADMNHSDAYSTEQYQRSVERLSMPSPRHAHVPYLPQKYASTEGSCRITSKIYPPKPMPLTAANNIMNIPSPAEDQLRLFSSPSHTNSYYNQFERFKYPSRQISNQAPQKLLPPGKFPPAVPAFPTSSSSYVDPYYFHRNRVQSPFQHDRNR